MSEPGNFLWHDYETFGTHPALDRPAQFGAIRTDTDFRPIGDPLEWYCAPSDDLLPHPAACLITGITPQDARARGLRETEFAKKIHTEMMEPGSCCVGYNNLKFDDEFTRNIFYRNFRDPYEREWRNGNSRFDLIGLARMCYALRPAGIEWPINEKGMPSFRLEDLTAANGIGHEGAHDALADVRATIELARLLKDSQPRLYEWALGLRVQKTAMALMNVIDPKPILHSSGRIPASRGCSSLFLPLAVYPDRPKSIISIDLMAEPDVLITGTAEEISDLVFTDTASLPEGMQRIPLKAIHSNKVPMLAPMATLRGVDTTRISLDPERCIKHANQIREHLQTIRPKVMEVFTRPHSDDNSDPDLLLYGGDFFSPHDRALMNKILATDSAHLGTSDWPFKDSRLPVMLFRYRARNYPETLSIEEVRKWSSDKQKRLIHPPVHGHQGLNELVIEVDHLREKLKGDGRAQRILDQLQAWYTRLDQELAD